jgi:hypothetical protein
MKEEEGKQDVDTSPLHHHAFCSYQRRSQETKIVSSGP